MDDLTKEILRYKNAKTDNDRAFLTYLLGVQQLKASQKMSQQIVTIKGDKGDTPQRGVDYLTKVEFDQIKKELTPVKGKDYRDGIDGNTPIIDHKAIAREAIKLIKIPKDGKTPIIDYGKIVEKVLENIRIPKDGKDGSPDMAEDIRNKLELFIGGPDEDKLKIEAIGGLEDWLKKNKAPGGFVMQPNITDFYANGARIWAGAEFDIVGGLNAVVVGSVVNGRMVYTINASGTGTPPGLPIVLGIDNHTGEQQIISNDGFSTLDIKNGFINTGITDGGFVSNNFYADASSINMNYSDGTNSGEVAIQAIDAHISHNLQIDMIAPTFSVASTINISLDSVFVEAGDISNVGNNTLFTLNDASQYVLISSGSGSTLPILFDMLNTQIKIGSVATPLDGVSGLTWNPVLVSNNVDSYSAINNYNRSATMSASADMICANDADDGSILGGHFVDMGINSSVYNPSISGLYTGGANAAYLLVNGGALSLMTQKSFPVYIRTGGYNNDSHIRMTVDAFSPIVTMGYSGAGGQTGVYQIAGATSGTNSITASATADQMIFKNLSGNTVQVLDNKLSAIYSGRVQQKRGADVASAGTITMGNDGNMFHVTGNNTINYMTSTDWQDGSEVVLVMTGKAGINSSAGSVPAGTKAFLLQGNVNWFSASKKETFIFRLDLGLDVWLQITPVGSH